eukprot:6487878-Amphidinium_carterae.1
MFFLIARFIGIRASLQREVILVHLWMVKSAALFHHRHTVIPARRIHSQRRRVIRGRTWAGLIHSLWLGLCLLASAPGVLYSLVKAVPGFLRISGLWRWLVGNAVALLSGVMTGFGLDLLAAKVSGPSVDDATLQIVGLWLASILFPCLLLSSGALKSLVLTHFLSSWKEAVHARTPLLHDIQHCAVLIRSIRQSQVIERRDSSVRFWFLCWGVVGTLWEG